MNLSRPLVCAFRSLPAVLLLFAGCTTEPVSLPIAAPSPGPGPRLDRPVAFVHPPEFRQRVETIEPYRNRYFIPLRLGAASDQALQAAYAATFAAVHAAGAPGTPETAGAALLQPTILRFSYVNASARFEGPYFAEVVYGFTLTSPDGVPIAAWQVRGFGEYDPGNEIAAKRTDAPRGETEMNIEAPRRAVADAVAAFRATVAAQPEIRRWASGRPWAECTAPASTQVAGPSGADGSVAAGYPGVIWVTARLTPLTGSVATAGVREGITPIHVALSNPSMHRLAIDPAAAEWRSADNTLTPVPPALASAALAGRPLGLNVGPLGPGPGMLPALLAALYNTAEVASHRKDLAQWRDVTGRGPFPATELGPGDVHEGMIYFAVAPDQTPDTLVVTVVDLDAERRYRVLLPLAGPPRRQASGITGPAAPPDPRPRP